MLNVINLITKRIKKRKRKTKKLKNKIKKKKKGKKWSIIKLYEKKGGGK